jgi:hypothetical protein
MSRDEELRGIAIALKKESLYFSGGWNINILQAFSRDGGGLLRKGSVEGVQPGVLRRP